MSKVSRTLLRVLVQNAPVAIKLVAVAALVIFATEPAKAAKSYRFVIETTLPDCRARCDIGVIKSDEKMSKLECKKALPIVKSIIRKNGLLRIKSAKCVPWR